MQTLLELGVKHGTDKVAHEYLEHYVARFAPLREKPITLLEIGVEDGGSLRMWRDWFPLGKVYGVDVNPKTVFTEDRIRVFCGAQENVTFLSDVAAETGPLDVVVDDGSHRGIDHVLSFDVLWPHLKNGGWYCIEDCQSIYNNCWTKLGDRTIMDELSGRWPQIITGRDSIREVVIVGSFIYSGLIMMRKGALRADLVDYPQEPLRA